MKKPVLVKQIPSQLESRVLEALPSLLPSFTVTAIEHTDRPGANPADLVVAVATPPGRHHQLCLRLQETPAPSRVREVLRKMKASLAGPHAAYPVLASTFLSPRVREICKEEGVGYLDVAGNCRLSLPDAYLEKVVERNPFPPRGRPASLFAPVSSRLIRVVLEAPSRAWTVQELSKTAGISLGQASNVCRRLLEEAYAVRQERRVRLTEPGKLLDAWRDQYDPSRHEPAAYYSFEREPDALMRRLAEVANARQWRYAVTGLAGASLVAPFVHGVGAVAWYVPDALQRAQWIEALDLRPVESGANALMLIPHDRGVWHGARAVEGVSVAGSVQLYLDLWHDPGRGREQAEFLRQETLKI